MRSIVPNRGDVWFIEFSRRAGKELCERHPAVFLTTYNFNMMTSYAIVCPITHTISGNSFEVVIPAGLPVQGAILIAQVRSIDWNLRIPERALLLFVHFHPH